MFIISTPKFLWSRITEEKGTELNWNSSISADDPYFVTLSKSDHITSDLPRFCTRIIFFAPWAHQQSTNCTSERRERERPHFYLVGQCHHPPTIIVTMIIIISCLFTTHRSRTRIKVTRKVLSFRIVWPLRKLYHRVRKWLELQRFFFVYHKYHQILKLTTKHQKISGILQRSGMEFIVRVA